MKTKILARWRPRFRLALLNLAGGGLSIGVVAAVALFFESSFLFPSLGPTAFLLFYAPKSEVSSPRSVLLGHLIGALAGWLSLAVFGLLDAPPALISGVDWPRVGAAALSLGGTSALMVLFDAVHPPAGATTLIVSLGLMPSLWQIPILMGAMLLLLGLAMILNRLAGVSIGHVEGALDKGTVAVFSETAEAQHMLGAGDEPAGRRAEAGGGGG